MNLNHLVILKRSPWYIYCDGEADAVEVAARFLQSEVVGIAVSTSSIEVKMPRTVTTLVQEETRALEHFTIDTVPDPLKIAETDEDALEKIMEETVGKDGET